MQAVRETTNRGGRRPGAGRPAKPNSRNRPKSIKVTDEMAAYLAARGTGVIEDALRRTKDFKTWQSNQTGQRSTRRKTPS